MIGGGVLRECLADPGVDEVISIVRRAGTVHHSKLREIVHADFHDFSSIAGTAFAGVDAVFFCLGVASAGMSEADYTRITYGITLAAAQTLLQSSPAASFIYVSGVGADSSERSRRMWARVRGRTENALLRLPLKTFIFRLALIQPVHGAVSRTPSYRLFYMAAAPLMPLLRMLFPASVTNTELVGRAMLEVARHGAPRPLLDSRDVNVLGRCKFERTSAAGAPRVATAHHAPLGALAGIGLIIALAAIAFVYTAGWLSPNRLTPVGMVDALSRRGGDPRGHRRNHAKGICFTGEFEASGAGASISSAPMLAEGSYPVIGRFAIATGNPRASDATARVRSMAIRILAHDGEEWRSGMNDSPVFAVSTPQAFYAMTRAQEVDPATGKPDPRAMQRFYSMHPESKDFAAWARSAPWTASYADQTYNSLNAFYFIDNAGRSHLVRWSMQPTLSPQPVPQASLATLGPDFLEQDLLRRLAQGSLDWHLIVTMAQPGDPSSDATRAWPANRQRVDVGTLVVQQASEESDGACRDYNYDPTILPVGIRPSGDPLLAARSSAYARSFDLRTAEAADYPHRPSHDAKPQ